MRMSKPDDNLAIRMPPRHKLERGVCLLNAKLVRIHSRHDVVLLHDIGDLTELRAIGTHEYEAVFLALFARGSVIPGARGRKQHAL